VLHRRVPAAETRQPTTTTTCKESSTTTTTDDGMRKKVTQIIELKKVRITTVRKIPVSFPSPPNYLFFIPASLVIIPGGRVI
jgi:hypothetical protein